MGRNAALLNQLKDELLSANNKNSVDIVIVELSEIKSVSLACDVITRQYSTLFAYVNLAAVIKRQRLLTSERMETMFATNYLAPYQLSTRLSGFYSDSLKIILVSSASTSKIDFDNLQGESKFSSIPIFSQSKTCNVLLVKKLSRQFESSNCVSIGFDPGIVKSKSMTEMPKFFQIIGKMVGKAPDKSAKALAEIIFTTGSTSGTFYDKHLKPIKTSNYSDDTVLQDKLDELTMELIKAKI